MHAHGHAAGMGITYLDMAVCHHGLTHKTHGSHANIIAQLLEFQFEFGNFWIGISVAHYPQASCLLAQHHGDVFGPAQANAHYGGLAREAAFAKRNQGVQQETFDAVYAISGKQHAVVGAEQAALVHRGDIHPVGVRFKAPLDFRSVDAYIVIEVGARGWPLPWLSAGPVRCRRTHRLYEHHFRP